MPLRRMCSSRTVLPRGAHPRREIVHRGREKSRTDATATCSSDAELLTGLSLRTGVMLGIALATVTTSPRALPATWMARQRDDLAATAYYSCMAQGAGGTAVALSFAESNPEEHRGADYLPALSPDRRIWTGALSPLSHPSAGCIRTRHTGSAGTRSRCESSTAPQQPLGCCSGSVAPAMSCVRARHHPRGHLVQVVSLAGEPLSTHDAARATRNRKT